MSWLMSICVVVLILILIFVLYVFLVVLELEYVRRRKLKYELESYTLNKEQKKSLKRRANFYKKEQDMIDIEVESFCVKSNCLAALSDNIKDLAAVGNVLIGGTLLIRDLRLIYNNQDYGGWLAFDLEYPDQDFYLMVDKNISIGLHKALLKVFKDKYRDAIGKDEWIKIYENYGKMFKEHMNNIRKKQDEME